MFEEEKNNSNGIPSGQSSNLSPGPDQPSETGQEATPQTQSPAPQDATPASQYNIPQSPAEPELSPLSEPSVLKEDLSEAPSGPSFSEPQSISPESSDLTLSELASASKPAPEIGNKTNVQAQFETPELAKKEIIKEANEADGSPEEELYVMSEKFRKAKAKIPAEPGKGGKKINLLIIGLVILVVIIGVAVFYLWNRGYFQKTQPTVQPVSEVKQQPEETTKVEESEEEPPLSLEKTLKKELRNDSDVIVSWAELYLPEGAIDLDTEIELDGNLLTEQESKYENNYKVIGGIYNFSAKKVLNEEIEVNEESKEEAELILKQPCSLKIFYDQNLIEEDWEQNLTIGYFKDDIWTPFPSSLDEEKNELTIASLEYLPADTWAIIIEKTKIAPKVETFQIAPNTPSSADTDKDGLTDVEEDVYKTEINNPDSDADGSPDGQEVITLTDPLQANESKLAVSSLINVYTNPSYSYGFFYPGSWLARAIPETGNQEVLVITNTGEFFSATVENNPEKLSPKDWYLRQSPRTDESLLYSTLVNNQAAVWNPNHLTIYIAKDEKIYILSYNVGTEEEANFKTTFEMLINSFQFVTQSQGRPDGTLIKYLDQPGIYLIEAGKKRAFASGEIFEKLGFKWEDVIEIPYTETYVDGELITGRLNGTLIKYSDQPSTYLIQAGKKRAFASGEIFEKLGFKWEDVIEIPAEEIYPDGPIIDSNVTTSQIQE